MLAAAKFETSEKYPKIDITLLSKFIDLAALLILNRCSGYRKF